MKKIIIFVFFFLCIPGIALAAEGQPFKDLQNQIDQLKQQVQQLQQNLASGLGEVQGQINNINSQVSTLTSQLSTAQAQINNLQSKVATLETGLTSTQQTLAVLQSNLVTRNEILQLIKENALSIQPDYDSSWFVLQAGESVDLYHGLHLYSASEEVLVFLLSKGGDGYQHSTATWMMTEWWSDEWIFWEYGARWGHLSNEYITVRNLEDNCKYEGRRPFSCLVDAGTSEPVWTSFRVLIWKVFTPLSGP